MFPEYLILPGSALPKVELPEGVVCHTNISRVPGPNCLLPVVKANKSRHTITTINVRLGIGVDGNAESEGITGVNAKIRNAYRAGPGDCSRIFVIDEGGSRL